MKKLQILIIIICGLLCTDSCRSQGESRGSSNVETKRMIFVYGNGLNRVFISYVAELTGQKNPKICFFPTAAADDPRVFAYWDRMVEGLAIDPCVIKTFISSSPEQKTFAEEIMDADAVIVGGGNTLNMIAIWQAQGIDTLLRQAYNRGVVMAGGSAGSLCWFTGGYSDSRPKELSVIDCLGFLDYSHCPHYNNADRRSLYLDAIKSGRLNAGYACDDDAALLFVDGKMSKSLSLSSESHNYFVSATDGKVSEELLPAQIIK